MLLSCSHAFHEACLHNFERYSNMKSCPLCRKENYQQKQIKHGAIFFKHKCATCIQAVWRGYKARQLFTQLLLETPPKDGHIRKSFCAAKLASVTDNWLDEIEHERSLIEQELAAMEVNLEKSKRIMKSIPAASIHWGDLTTTAIERGISDCPICITPMHIAALSNNQNIGETELKIVALLSCSHLFHETCIASFEEFCEGRTFMCPVCRSPYQRTKLSKQRNRCTLRSSLLFS